MYTRLLRGCKTFNLNFSEEFLSKLAPYLRERTFQPEEIIYETDKPTQFLFFILRGTVSLSFKVGGTDRFFHKLGKEEVFGEHSFFSSTPSDHNAVSMNVLHTVFIDKNDFL